MKKLLFIILLFCILISTDYAQVCVIANKSVEENSISSSKLADIYSLINVKWSNGSKIVVFEQAADNDAKSKFYGYISKEPLSLKKEWLKKQFSGEAKVPDSVPSDEEMISKVASTPGAIGYVKNSSLNGSVKVLAEIK
jgi:ABC-type phosphate transport system substrate-binding protein